VRGRRPDDSDLAASLLAWVAVPPLARAPAVRACALSRAPAFWEQSLLFALQPSAAGTGAMAPNQVAASLAGLRASLRSMATLGVDRGAAEAVATRAAAARLLRLPADVQASVTRAVVAAFPRERRVTLVRGWVGFGVPLRWDGLAQCAVVDPAALAPLLPRGVSPGAVVLRVDGRDLTGLTTGSDAALAAVLAEVPDQCVFVLAD
jgi:hypothetical protein